MKEFCFSSLWISSRRELELGQRQTEPHTSCTHRQESAIILIYGWIFDRLLASLYCWNAQLHLAPQQDAATISSWCSVIRFKAWTSTYLHIHSGHRFFIRRHLVCQCRLLQIAVILEVFQCDLKAFLLLQTLLSSMMLNSRPTHWCSWENFKVGENSPKKFTRVIVALIQHIFTQIKVKHSLRNYWRVKKILRQK